MKRVYLLRHALADPGAARMVDKDRPLLPDGREDARALNAHFERHSLVFERIICSTAMRTRETLALAVPSPHPDTIYDDALYLASQGDLLRMLQNQPETVRTLLLIGHNPGLQQCAMTLVGSGDPLLIEQMELNFVPCGMAVIDCDSVRWDELSPQCGHLVDYWRP